MGALLKLFLIIILLFYAFKFLLRLIAPFLIQKASNTIRKKAEQQFREKRHNPVREGETVVDKNPNKNLSNNKSVGEYIDFEEVD